MFNNCFIARFPQSVSVKEFLQSVNIWQRFGGTSFTARGVCTSCLIRPIAFWKTVNQEGRFCLCSHTTLIIIIIKNHRNIHYDAIKHCTNARNTRMCEQRAAVNHIKIGALQRAATT